MQEPPQGYQFNLNGGIYRKGAAHNVEVRRNFLRDWLQSRSAAKVPELCATHGISTATGYRWIAEYEDLNKIEASRTGKSWKIDVLILPRCPSRRPEYLPSLSSLQVSVTLGLIQTKT